MMRPVQRVDRRGFPLTKAPASERPGYAWIRWTRSRSGWRSVRIEYECGGLVVHDGAAGDKSAYEYERGFFTITHVASGWAVGSRIGSRAKAIVAVDELLKLGDWTKLRVAGVIDDKAVSRILGRAH